MTMNNDTADVFRKTVRTYTLTESDATVTLHGEFTRPGTAFRVAVVTETLAEYQDGETTYTIEAKGPRLTSTGKDHATITDKRTWEHGRYALQDSQSDFPAELHYILVGPGRLRNGRQTPDGWAL